MASNSNLGTGVPPPHLTSAWSPTPEVPTSQTTSTSTSKQYSTAKVKPGVIAAAAVAGFIGLALFLALGFYLGRRYRTRASSVRVVVAQSPPSDRKVSLESHSTTDGRRSTSPIWAEVEHHITTTRNARRVSAANRTAITDQTIVVPPLVAEVKERTRLERTTDIQTQSHELEMMIIKVQEKLLKRDRSKDQLMLHRREETKAALRAQLKLLKSRHSAIQVAMKSDWAQGVSDVPPPGYENALNA